MFVQILLLFPEQEKIQIHKESHLFENSALGWWVSSSSHPLYSVTGKVPDILLNLLKDLSFFYMTHLIDITTNA